MGAQERKELPVVPRAWRPSPVTCASRSSRETPEEEADCETYINSVGRTEITSENAEISILTTGILKHKNGKIYVYCEYYSSLRHQQRGNWRDSLKSRNCSLALRSLRKTTNEAKGS